jgi:2,4-dienoyl-CoA reductase (NADPH2)
MSQHERFQYRDSGELLAKAAELGVLLPFQDSIDPLFSPARISGIEVPNRIAVHPMEGCDATMQGAPDDLTFRRYRRYARGGSGLIWFEACSVTPNGRSNPRQLLLNAENLDAFRALVEATRDAARERFGTTASPYLVLQLTHSGRRSIKSGQSRPRAACFRPMFEKSPDDVDLFRDDELVEIRERFVAAAQLALLAGFDAVDIKACHGYLLHELLSAFTRSDSRYGGTYAGRCRLLIEIVRRIREVVPRLAIAVRLNATDAVPYPFGFGMEKTGGRSPDLWEPLTLQRQLIDEGCSLLNVTAGIPFFRPHVGRPFDRPAKGGARPDVHPLVGVADLLRWASEFQKAQPATPIVGTGYSWLRQFWPHVGAAAIVLGWTSFVGLGRASFAYPDAPLDLQEHGKLDPRKCCIACSCCTDLMRNHQVSGCVLRDPGIYKCAYKNIK